MKAYSGFHTLYDNNRTLLNIAKAELIPGVPNKFFTDIQYIYKDIRNNTELIRIETKKNMTTRRRTAVGTSAKHKRLQPGENTLSKKAGENEIVRRFRGISA